MPMCGLGLWLAAGSAGAAPSCTITSTAINFGNYDPLSATALTGIGTLSFTCTTGVGAGVTITSIKLSTGSSGSFAPRKMKNGANVLNYNLYTTAALTTVWGDGTAGTGYFSGGPYRKSVMPVTITVYGQIFALQNSAPGAYAEPAGIVATVVF